MVPSRTIKKLAECPEGFQRDEPFMVRDHHSVLEPNQDISNLSISLYEESYIFLLQIQCRADEPWESIRDGADQKFRNGQNTPFISTILKGILNWLKYRKIDGILGGCTTLEKPENAQSIFLHLHLRFIWGFMKQIILFDEESRNATMAVCMKFSLAPGNSHSKLFRFDWIKVPSKSDSACRHRRKTPSRGCRIDHLGRLRKSSTMATLHPPCSDWCPTSLERK